MDWLGFRYLVLRRFAEHPGTLETIETTEIAAAPASIEAAPNEAVPA